jgi:hypothetical protein
VRAALIGRRLMLRDFGAKGRKEKEVGNLDVGGRTIFKLIF